ncbi:Cu(I)-responsive transcriptional regulator [Pseudaminobacter sp. NGMCC 1.201702]|uniref:Cu(I)-responsive transcriptional regulator n=1 Tax=Pseudaminobacter sp. NGMCC 1.201702 TaxID=3391825 RepID=UPI0039EE58F5
MNIGQTAAAWNVSAKMIRYYESIELIPAAARSEAGYRVYSQTEVNTLRFIHRARELGFSMDDVRRLLALWQDESRTSAEVKAIALECIEELQNRTARLQALRESLLHLAARCNGDDRPQWPILDDLSGEGGKYALLH